MGLKFVDSRFKGFVRFVDVEPGATFIGTVRSTRGVFLKPDHESSIGKELILLQELGDRQKYTSVVFHNVGEAEHVGVEEVVDLELTIRHQR